LVNRNGFSIHHLANSAWFCPVAFIFDERRARMVNRLCAAANRAPHNSSRREPDVKSHLLKTAGVKVRKEPMPTHRRRFRIEEAYIGGDVPMPVVADGEVGPMHREIMSELRAIRAQMAHGGGSAGRSAAAETLDASVTREVAEAHALLETYRAQIEQCEKLKVELDLIYDAINRTKREIAVLHGKSFNGEEMARVNGELGAVVGGTEEATQQILEAAESIDNAASALGKVNSLDQQKILSEEIQERVVSIFEACNFQDLTGQHISKVMTTMKFIENHITVMMDIWGGVDAIKAHAPPIVDDRAEDDKLLNGPKLDGDAGHASQNDIDALFD
jgi:chemotaxis protein CheZ